MGPAGSVVGDAEVLLSWRRGGEVAEGPGGEELLCEQLVTAGSWRRWLEQLHSGVTNCDAARGVSETKLESKLCFIAQIDIYKYASQGRLGPGVGLVWRAGQSIQ